MNKLHLLLIQSVPPNVKSLSNSFPSREEKTPTVNDFPKPDFISKSKLISERTISVFLLSFGGGYFAGVTGSVPLLRDC